MDARLRVALASMLLASSCDCGAVAAEPATADRDRTPEQRSVPDFARVADAVSPSVVSVISTVPRSSEHPDKVVRGLGSGMVVDADGQVLTNAHVIASASQVDVELSSGERYRAQVLLAEPRLDLALLEIEAEQLPTVRFSSTPARPGSWVMAVGQPFGLGHTVTVGVISGLGRDHDDLGRPEGLPANGLWSFIQTDASINIGNSGGPLVNVRGEVVGITTAVRSDGQGLAFATPAAMVVHFLAEARNHGRVRPARLGIKAENADEPLPGGAIVRVTHVSPEGAAGRAGLEVGDRIAAVDGQRVKRVSEVAYRTQLRGVGQPVEFAVVRPDGSRATLTLTPQE